MSTEYKARGLTSNEDSIEEDSQNCTICLGPWTNSCEHRLVSLRCGHLFGRSCITRWLGGESEKCPQCNEDATVSDIRNIYAKTLEVMDCRECDKIRTELQKEKELHLKSVMDLKKEIEENVEDKENMLEVKQKLIKEKELNIEVMKALQKAKEYLMEALRDLQKVKKLLLETKVLVIEEKKKTRDITNEYLEFVKKYRDSL